MNFEEASSHINSVFAQVSILAKDLFGVDISKTEIIVSDSKSLSPGTAYSLRPNHRIRFRIGLLLASRIAGFTEYKSYSRDPRIGSFATTDKREWLVALVCHEAAHIINYELKRLKIPVPGFSQAAVAKANHSPIFRHIYKKIRIVMIPRETTYYEGNIYLDATPVRKKVVAYADFPEKGTMVEIHGKKYEVVLFKPRNYKYPFIAVNGNKRYKLLRKTVEAAMK